MLWALSSEIGHLIFSVMAWVLLGTPLGDESAFSIHGFNISKWRVLLLAASIPPTLAFVLICFLPESPEYLNQVRTSLLINFWNLLHNTELTLERQEIPRGLTLQIKAHKISKFLEIPRFHLRFHGFQWSAMAQFSV